MSAVGPVHRVWKAEAVWVSKALNYNDGSLEATETIDERPIDDLADENRISCECGERFDTVEEAEEHLESVRTS